MVAVLLAPFGEGALVSSVGLGVEHSGIGVVPRDALAF
jgi:hypothetical protein